MLEAVNTRFVLVLGVMLAACGGGTSDTPAVSEPPSTVAVLSTVPAPLALTTPGPTETVHRPDAVLIGAGDIAVSGGNQEETAALIELFPDATVFTTGDNAYPDGTAAEFSEHYEPTWGAFKERTRPSIGNHDAHSEGAVPYFEYFGIQAGNPGEGWYSYDLSSWHVIVLNSDCGARRLASCEEQLTWLERDLAENGRPCILAYWHKPVFNAGKHPNFDAFTTEWAMLDTAGVDLVLNGHDHNYQRFAAQDSNGEQTDDGIREFVVGSGGARIYEQTKTPANLEVFYEGHGVLKLDLYQSSYGWTFLSTSGSFDDSGTATCTGN